MSDTTTIKTYHGLYKLSNDNFELDISIMGKIPYIYIYPKDTDGKRSSAILKFIIYERLVDKITDRIDRQLQNDQFDIIELTVYQNRVKVNEGEDPNRVPNKCVILNINITDDDAILTMRFIGLDNKKHDLSFSLKSSITMYAKDEYQEYSDNPNKLKVIDGVSIFNNFLKDKLRQLLINTIESSSFTTDNN